MSAVSSDIGKDPHFFNKHLVGGVAISTFGHWASKVCISSNDPGGNGTFPVTTIQGKTNILHFRLYLPY
jgi:hypothetical protein